MDERRRIVIPGNTGRSRAVSASEFRGQPKPTGRGRHWMALQKKKKYFLLSLGEGEEPQALQNA
jgi:hypothetical protein